MNNNLILLIDDEPSILKSLESILADEQLNTKSFTSAEEAQAFLQTKKSQNISAILLDIWLPKMDGISLLQWIKAQSTLTFPVIMISGHATIETAVQATKYGAYDFIEKPLQLEKILLTLHNAIQESELKQANIELWNKKFSVKSLSGTSPAIQKTHSLIEKAANSTASVLITGQNGTGKEIAARQIHFLSNRKNEPFIIVNCAAIPHNLVESELFGHIEGAFHHLTKYKEGFLSRANKGTLFLDEVADMTLETQAKILRILEDKTFIPVGTSTEQPLETRIISATNHNILEAIKQGKFREDLYYRLNVLPIHIPPLHERVEDIPLLVNTFLDNANKEINPSQKKTIDSQVIQFLQAYNFPGNVRELKNLIERLVIITTDNHITAKDLPSNIKQYKQGLPATIFNLSLEKALFEFERTFIYRQLKDNDWELKKTADTIGITKKDLNNKINFFNINVTNNL